MGIQHSNEEGTQAWVRGQYDCQPEFQHLFTSYVTISNSIFLCMVLGFELRAYTLSHFTRPFL
jgi:hypothetical protein